MEEDGRRLPLRSVLIAAGTAGIVFALVAPSFLGEGAGALFLPALILLFIGRSMNRGKRRRPIESLPQASPRRETTRPKEAAAPRRPDSGAREDPAPRPKPAPTPPQVDADLEKVLAS